MKDWFRGPVTGFYDADLNPPVLMGGILLMSVVKKAIPVTGRGDA
jgi:hypothetical protein